MSNNPQNVLLALVGLTPQIITETLYYLMVKEGVIIDQVEVITTEQGRATMDRHFEEPFANFCADFNLNRKKLRPRISVINEGTENGIGDIRSNSDNHLTAVHIFKKVHDLTRDPGQRVFASLAGGRKTMSTYLGFAMQLFARPGDRLMHVLVNPPEIEGNFQFFYPRPGQATIPGRRRVGESWEAVDIPTAQVRIELADIPFVRMAGILEGQGIDSFEDIENLVLNAQLQIDQTIQKWELEINLHQQCLIIHKPDEVLQIPLSPRRIVFLYYLASQGKIINNHAHNGKHAARLLRLYRDYAGSGQERVSQDSFSVEKISNLRSQVARELKKALPLSSFRTMIIPTYHPTSEGSLFSISLPAHRLRLEPEVDENGIR